MVTAETYNLQSIYETDRYNI